ncbi:RusA family crossover junction endodeoxyribonuclease [Azospirillum sp. A1-3]|uniref:RusA family crossover junction endodeoxyribonuclease n=1 Tax=Azospirillum sp. A1-3 TaxID=185874 RepID=UPI0020774674|nr:RusA family crossover junction endodeoxyribonuclease [Azospirillum sp. A1-3]MCM8734606.1 RusA family crossover junction endodeoxyribonuclease [Azospirillum sp. A1-3]
MTCTITLTMPAPPSVNNLFKNLGRRGRAPTPAYEDWKRVAGWQVKAQRPQPISGPIAVTIVHGKRRADLDNLNKAPLDLLVSLGLIDDDAFVRELHCSFGEVDGCRVTIKQMETA